MRAGGFPGNPGRPRRLHRKDPPGGGHRLTKPEAVDAAPGVRRSEAAGARMVPPGEGNEARGDGRRGIGVSHSTAEAGGIEPTRPRGGKGAPAGGTGGGKDGQHTEVGSRLHVTTTDSRTGQTSLGDGGGHRLASWTSGYATARSEAICRGAGCGRTRTSGSVGGQGQQRPWSTRPGEATSSEVTCWSEIDAQEGREFCSVDPIELDCTKCDIWERLAEPDHGDADHMLPMR